MDPFETVRLSSGDGLAATFAPGAGMVCCSLTHDGEELLETRGGLANYIEKRSTMGIPLLYPWGNRLGALSYSAAGQDVVLDPVGQVPPLRLDPNGLPIHGALAASPNWEVFDEGESALGARLDFGAHPDLMAVFPFAHVVEQRVSVAGSVLTIATRVMPSGDVAVPLAFGFHPFFRLPDAPAESWEIDFPVRRRLLTDERMIPTGETVNSPIEIGPLGARVFDDGYEGVEDGARFVVSGGGRRLVVTFEAGYPVAVIWRPHEGQFLCIEPMTAPTNALVTGDGLRVVVPGEVFEARFSVAVSAV